MKIERMIGILSVLLQKEKIYEILRLMGSNESSAAVKAAEEMIEYSSKKKTELRGKS